jgi:hypothetical protein
MAKLRTGQWFGRFLAASREQLAGTAVVPENYHRDRLCSIREYKSGCPVRVLFSLRYREKTEAVVSRILVGHSPAFMAD